MSRDDLDGCDLDFTDPAQLTQDGEQTLALVMFADCWDSDEAVEERRVELIEWAAAMRGGDDV
jgi:hypothetical protein